MFANAIHNNQTLPRQIIKMADLAVLHEALDLARTLNHTDWIRALKEEIKRRQEMN